MNFDKVETFVQDAKAITWDTCHKIYVLMDDEQVDLMRKHEYDPIITTSEATPEQMLETLKQWFDASCGLRFIDAIWTNHDDPNAGFETLIGQFLGEDYEEDDDWEEDEDE